MPGVNRNIALHALPLLGIPHFLFLLSQFSSYFSFFPSPLHTYWYTSITVHPIFHCNSMNLVIWPPWLGSTHCLWSSYPWQLLQHLSFSQIVQDLLDWLARLSFSIQMQNFLHQFWWLTQCYGLCHSAAHLSIWKYGSSYFEWFKACLGFFKHVQLFFFYSSPSSS